MLYCCSVRERGGGSRRCGGRRGGGEEEEAQKGRRGEKEAGEGRSYWKMIEEREKGEEKAAAYFSPPEERTCLKPDVRKHHVWHQRVRRDGSDEAAVRGGEVEVEDDAKHEPRALCFGVARGRGIGEGGASDVVVQRSVVWGEGRSAVPPIALGGDSDAGEIWSCRLCLFSISARW